MKAWRPISTLLSALVLAASACAAMPTGVPLGALQGAPATVQDVEVRGATPTSRGAASPASAPAAQDDASLPAPSLGERAMVVVRALADGIGSRPAGTAAERAAARYLAEELGSIGYAVEVVPFTYSSRAGSGTSQNVVARHPNEDPSLPLVIIGAHYDSVPFGPGANDNGSGTATMVEVARELAWSPVPNVAVRYVAFGAEEIGLLGSEAYARQLSREDRARLRVMISIDMMAVGEQPAFGGSEPWLSEALARAASQGYEPLNLSGFLRRLSDHASFLDAGLPAMMFHWVEDPYYHTRFDVSENVQPWSMDLMGAIAIELVRVAAAAR